MESEVRQVEEEGKSTKVIKKGKKILAYAYMVDIFDENEILHYHSFTLKMQSKKNLVT